MPDKYASYAELRAGEAPDAFEITVGDRNTPAVVVAPHGGKIEVGTTQIAAAVAGEAVSAYSFTGKKPSDNFDLHITATKFDEPMALALVSRSAVCVTIHGAKGEESVVFLGGLDETLKGVLRQRLAEAGFEPVDPDDPELQGKDPCNICNRGASGAGVQLEITRGLRDALTDEDDPGAPDRLASFAAAVRGAIEGRSGGGPSSSVAER
jgi:phage replication-related protein YjqB (UPF0714/DUF867 family)